MLRSYSIIIAILQRSENEALLPYIKFTRFCKDTAIFAITDASTVDQIYKKELTDSKASALSFQEYLRTMINR